MELTIRPAQPGDVAAMAAIRAQEWQTKEYWDRRIGGYLRGEIGAQHALEGHAVFVASRDQTVVGFIAGHRTTRHACQGELEWIDVVATHRRQGIAGQLIVTLTRWFVEQQALRVCIDVKPDNIAARSLYARYGAVDLKPNWMVWEDIRTALVDSDSATTFGV
jgi:ribosomal protein S18 acetylase RimI-like enzyme